MKNPHDVSTYSTVDEEPNKTETPDAAETPETVETPETAEAVDKPAEKRKKQKRELSGAYYYVEVDAQKLATASFARTALTVIAFLLQLTVQIMPIQAGAEYVSKHISSYAFFYMLFTIFGVGVVSIWLCIMNIVRYKFVKRIPVEHAPKGGFQKRAYFGAELYMAVNAVMLVFQLSFVCIKYDGWGLAGLFITAAALAAAVAARQVTHLTLRHSEHIPAPENPEQTTETTQE